jgi:hypothetical protein
MYEKIKNSTIAKSIIDTKNLGLYIILLFGLSVTWSTIKQIQKNYELQKQITTLQASVALQDQINKNETLQINYYKTNDFLSLAARKYFNKALPGEKLILVPSSVSSKYIHQTAIISNNDSSNKHVNKIVKNWQDWINFFLHKDADS